MGYSVTVLIQDDQERASLLERLLGLCELPMAEADGLSDRFGRQIAEVGLRFIRAASNDGSDDESLSYDHHPWAVGFDYGDYDPAWAIMHRVAVVHGVDLRYDGEPAESEGKIPGWSDWAARIINREGKT